MKEYFKNIGPTFRFKFSMFKDKERKLLKIVVSRIAIKEEVDTGFSTLQTTFSYLQKSAEIVDRLLNPTMCSVPAPKFPQEKPERSLQNQLTLA